MPPCFRRRRECDGALAGPGEFAGHRNRLCIHGHFRTAGAVNGGRDVLRDAVSFAHRLDRGAQLGDLRAQDSRVGFVFFLAMDVVSV